MDDVQVSKKPSNSPKHYTKDISSEKETKSSQETPDVQLPSLHSLNTMAEVAETVLASEPSLSKGVSSPSPNIQNVNEPTTDPSLMNMRPIPSPPMSSTYGVLPPSMLFPYVPRYSQSMNQQVTALPVQYPPFPLSSQYGSIIPPMKIQSRASTLADHGENISTSPSTLPSSGPQESSLPTTSVKSNNNESPSMLSSTSSPRRQSLESLIMVGDYLAAQRTQEKARRRASKRTMKGRDEFPKSSPKGDLLDPEDRRLIHNVSERRRRDTIKEGFSELKSKIPGISRERRSKVDILHRGEL
jgi:hypothetical protein